MYSFEVEASEQEVTAEEIENIIKTKLDITITSIWQCWKKVLYFTCKYIEKGQDY